MSRVDEIFVIKDGVISEFGSYEDLMKANGEFQALINEHITTKEASKESKEEAENPKPEDENKENNEENNEKVNNKL